jgi:hypothetical protein
MTGFWILFLKRPTPCSIVLSTTALASAVISHGLEADTAALPGLLS